MANRLTYTDAQLTSAIAQATSWGDVMEQLGKRRGQNRTWVMARATRLQLDTSHLDGLANHETPVIPSRPHPFQGQSHFGSAKGRVGLATAACWFLQRGYNVSIPVEAAPYDLLAESDDGIKRVQVKTSNRLDGEVGLGRHIYDRQATPSNRHGTYRLVPYTAAEIDFFFIVTADGDTYLVPIEHVGGLKSISSLDRKYAAFCVGGPSQRSTTGGAPAS